MAVNMNVDFSVSTPPDGTDIMVAMVTIIGDSILENNEDFQVALQSSDPRVVISGNASTTVTIVDDDGMYSPLQSDDTHSCIISL